MSLALALVLAATVDGQAALRHASALGALGPHPWGSPRNQAAAEYVAAEMRAAGLTAVEMQGFEAKGIRGTNVVATLKGPSDEVIVVCAHHDTVPEAPGAYDDAGGVGVMLEVARVIAAQPLRARTFVFASFDGEEGWVQGAPVAGSRAYVERLGAGARRIVGVLDVEMSGWAAGTPLLQPFSYADPRRRGQTVIAPAWLVRTALEGSRAAGSPLGVHDPWLSWIAQPASRAFVGPFNGDDLAFLETGIPAVTFTDSSFTAFYPHYHQATDTADKLDPAALERMGVAVLGAARALDRSTGRQGSQPSWFAAFGHVFGGTTLLALGVLSLLPGLRAGFATGGPGLGARLVQAGLFGVLLWRRPVVAVFTLLLPNALLPMGRRRLGTLVALAPFAALLVLVAVGWWRGMLLGTWLAPWEMAAFLGALVLAFLRPPGGKRATRRRRRR